MRALARLISAAFRLAALETDPHFSPGRFRIYFTYLRLILLRTFSNVFAFKPQSTKLFGYHWHFTNIESLLYVFEEIFIDQIYRFSSTTESPRILDIGANTGIASLYFKLRWPNARIECFEPNPEAHRLLRSNLLDNGLTGITLRTQAFAAYAGQIEFPIDELNPSSPNAGASALQNSKFHVVDAIKLDSVLQEPFDFLKMDIEGAEFDVLKSSAHCLYLVRRMVIECHHRPDIHDGLAGILSVFSEKGFQYRLSSQPARVAFNTPQGQDILISVWT